MLQVTNLTGFGSSSVADPSVGYLQQKESASAASSYTFSSENIGATGTGRLIIVGVYAFAGASGRTLTSATIGGVTATVLTAATGPNSLIGAVIAAKVPTGTSADIVVNFSGAMDRCGIMTYRALNVSSATPSSSDTDNAGGTSPSTSVTAGAGTITVSSLSFANSTAPSTTMSGVTEDDEQEITSAINKHACGSATKGSGTVSGTITPGASYGSVLCTAVFL